MASRLRSRSREDYVFKIDMGVWFFAPGELEADRQLVEAFKAFKYDIRNPQHWRWIVQELSIPLRHSGKGRPPKWTKAAYTKLLGDLFWLQRELRFNSKGVPSFHRKPIVSGVRAQAALLKKAHAFEPLYRTTSVDEIYKHLLKAQKAQILEVHPDAKERGSLKPPRKRRVAKK